MYSSYITYTYIVLHHILQMEYERNKMNTACERGENSRGIRGSELASDFAIVGVSTVECHEVLPPFLPGPPLEL